MGAATNGFAMANELPENPDLAWELDDFSQAQRAKDFVMQFETTAALELAQRLYAVRRRTGSAARLSQPV